MAVFIFSVFPSHSFSNSATASPSASSSKDVPNFKYLGPISAAMLIFEAEKDNSSEIMGVPGGSGKSYEQVRYFR